MEFRTIELQDKDWVDSLLHSSGFRGCEYNFNTMFLWQFVFATKISRFEERLLVRSGREQYSYLFPPGSSDVGAAINQIEKQAQKDAMPFQMHSVNPQAKAEIETLFPGEYDFFLCRNDFDYIYDSESLRTLKGKKLHGKRNHINRFLQVYEGRWNFEPITEDNIHECKCMNKEWCKTNGCYVDDSKLQEQCAVAQAFRHFFDLGLEGGLLRIDNEVVAFTFGEPLNSDTYLMHVEKAFADIQGAYPMINQQFATTHCEKFSFINREDDTGAAGLRKAKLSYRPAFFEEKFLARRKDQLNEDERQRLLKWSAEQMENEDD